MTGFKEVSISVLLEEIGEERTQEILADYSCPLNQDIEYFLKEKSILFSKQRIAQTHLVFAGYKEKPVLVGYYALAYKSVRIKSDKLNSAWRRRVRTFATYDEETRYFWASLPLIGQLGKNYTNEYNQLITGDELLKLACNRIEALQTEVGGKMAYLECEDSPGLVRFYEENGFFRFANRNMDKDEIGEKRYLVQMIKYFKSKRES